MSILVIANPKSGRYNPKKLEKIRQILVKRFGETAIVLTEYEGHATIIAKDSQAKVVIAAGGDGLINEVAQGVVQTDKIFSALCFGSVNVFCREYGIGLNPLKSAKRLQIDRFKSIPVGYVNSRIFLTMAGFGFDAQTVSRVNKWRITNIYILSEILHILHGYLVLLKHEFPKFEIYINGKENHTYHAIISISTRYAGNFKLGKISKDKLNIFSIRKDGIWSILKTIISIFFGCGFKGSYETSKYIKVKGVTSCQIDGQYLEFDKNDLFLHIKEKAIKLAS